MDALITVFHNYAGNDGDKHKLNKGELKQLLHSELTDFLTVKNVSGVLPRTGILFISDLALFRAIHRNSQSLERKGRDGGCLCTSKVTCASFVAVSIDLFWPGRHGNALVHDLR